MHIYANNGTLPLHDKEDFKALLTASSSTSTTKNIIDLYFFARLQKSGNTSPHGPHHVALKFTKTC